MISQLIAEPLFQCQCAWSRRRLLDASLRRRRWRGDNAFFACRDSDRGHL